MDFKGADFGWKHADGIEWRVYLDQYVCIDCRDFIADGTLPEDQEESDRLMLEFDRYAQENIEWRLGSQREQEDEHGGLTKIDLEDLEFSWAECDCCGSSLGGSRHPAHFVTQG